MHNGRNLQVISDIFILMLFKISGLITNHMSILHKVPTKSFLGSITTHHNITIWIHDLKKWCTSDQSLQLLETFFALGCPFKFAPFFYKDVMGCVIFRIFRWIAYNIQSIPLRTLPMIHSWLYDIPWWLQFSLDILICLPIKKTFTHLSIKLMFSWNF